MAKFRKKSIVIDAVQFRRGEQDSAFADDVISGRVRYTQDDTMLIGTLEGVMEARPGDWIVRGIKGELYPVRPDIFAASYEPANEPPASDPRDAVVEAALWRKEVQKHLEKAAREGASSKVMRAHQNRVDLANKEIDDALSRLAPTKGDG